jgi:hypothetical protein
MPGVIHINPFETVPVLQKVPLLKVPIHQISVSRAFPKTARPKQGE